MTDSFNLLDEPWIPVRRLDGSEADLSLRAAFAEAHTIRTLNGELPTQYAAILRLMLAILHRAAPTAGHPEERWSGLWERGRFDAGAIDQYLMPYAERFDLLHPVAPFYQVADLHTEKGEFSSLARLVLDVPAGEQFFTTRTASSLDRMPLAEAARWVVHSQAYDPSGIKSGAVGDDRVKNGKGYPIGIAWCGWLGMVILEGRSLFETLLLNLVLPKRSKNDSAVWERPRQTAAVDLRPEEMPYGVADVLTWQSRRIRLRVEGDAATGVLLANGDPLHPRNLQDYEPMTAWRRSEAQEKATKLPLVLMPRAHQVDRGFWRGLGGLLNVGIDPKQAGQPAGVIEWLAFLQEHQVLAPDYLLTARAIGIEYGSQSSVVDEIYDDGLVLETAVLVDPELRGLAVAAVQDADHAVRVLGDFARNLTLAAGGDPERPRERARAAAYAELDRRYRDWVFSLTPDTDRDAVHAAWQRQVRVAIVALAEQLSRAAGLPALLGRDVTVLNKTQFLNAAIAERYLFAGLHRGLPHAFPIKEDDDDQ